MPKIAELVGIKSFFILMGIANSNAENLYSAIQTKSQYEFSIKIEGNGSLYHNMEIEVIDEKIKKEMIDLFYNFQQDKIGYEPRIVEKFVVEVKVKRHLPLVFVKAWKNWKAPKGSTNKCLDKNNFCIKSPNIVLDSFDSCRIELEEYSKEQLLHFDSFVDYFCFYFKNA